MKNSFLENLVNENEKAHDNDSIKNIGAISFTDVIEYVKSGISDDDFKTLCADISSGKVRIGMDAAAVSTLIASKENTQVKRLFQNAKMPKMDIDVNSMSELPVEDFRAIRSMGVNVGKVYVNSGWDEAAARGYTPDVYETMASRAEAMVDKAKSDLSKKNPGKAFENMISINEYKEKFFIKANEHTHQQISKNKQIRKYIPYIYVEEQYYKEMVRYFADPALFVQKALYELLRYDWSVINDELIKEATDKVNEAQEEFDKEKKDAEDKIKEAEDEIADGKRKIANGEKELADGEKELQTQRTNASVEFTNAENQLNDASQKLDQGQTELNTKINEFNSKKPEAEAGLKQLQDGIKQVQSGITSVNQVISNYEALDNQVKSDEAAIDSNNTRKEELYTNLYALNAKLAEETDLAEKEKIKAEINELESQIATITQDTQTLVFKVEATKAAMEEKKDEYGGKSLKELYEESKAQLPALQEQLNTLNKQLDETNNTLNYAQEEIKKAQAQIDQGRAELESGRQQLAAKRAEADQKFKEAEDEIAANKKKIANSKKEITDGEKELEEKKQEFNEKISDAEAKLIDAREKINDIETAKWYIFDRYDMNSFNSYSQDAENIRKLGIVFPIAFFLIATLISLTTMSRMVEEDRVQVGTLKALGYNNGQIMSKYIIYSLLASIIGGILGATFGVYFIPYVIIIMYQIMYEIPEVIIEYNWYYTIFGIGIMSICIVAACIYTALQELKNTPAELMRPKAPKLGKRVLIERITFIWKHLNFIQKVTLRNMFRYKKRFLMTIFGISGCMALIIAGYGLKDSISRIMDRQYGEIYHYDLMVGLKNTLTREEIDSLVKTLEEDEKIDKSIEVYMTSYKVEKDDVIESQIVSISHDQDIESVITLRDYQTREKLVLNDEEVIITEKLAQLINAKVGDEITLKDVNEDEYKVKVGAITEHYIQHDVYMTDKLYKKVFSEEKMPNVLLTKYKIEVSKENEDKLSKELLNNVKINSVVSTTYLRSTINNTLEAMDLVVYVLIISAGLLAFIVLYNLANVNISERIRELATIKVLGFYDKEVYDYITREIVLLTIIGILFGMVLGNILNSFILGTCEIEVLKFRKIITVNSYMISAAITAVFTMIVNFITYFSLKKVDMIESLKSIE